MFAWFFNIDTTSIECFFCVKVASSPVERVNYASIYAISHAARFTWSLLASLQYQSLALGKILA